MFLFCRKLAAQSVLNDEITAIVDPRDYNLTTKDMLRFWYYGGMIYIGLKDYDKALRFLQQVYTYFSFWKSLC